MQPNVRYTVYRTSKVYQVRRLRGRYDAQAFVVFLALHVLGNAAFLLLVRVGRGPRFDYPIVGLTNYATGAVLGVAGLAVAGLGGVEPLAAVFGAVNGAQYQVTYQLMYVLFGLVGVAVTTSIMRLSVVVPVVASILVWGEWPNVPQALGLAMAGAALPLLSAGGARVEVGRLARARSVALIVGTVAVSGCGLLAAKAFAELGRPEQRPVYVLACYVVATAFSVLAWPARGRMQGARTVTTGQAWRRSVALGVLVGVMNIGQIWVLLPALEQVPGVIAFPVASAGGLALAVVGAWVVWRERLSARAGAGVALAMGAAALANAG